MFTDVADYPLGGTDVVKPNKKPLWLNNRPIINAVAWRENKPTEDSLVKNQKIEALTGRPRCPSCGRYQDECICVRTQLGV